MAFWLKQLSGAAISVGGAAWRGKEEDEELVSTCLVCSAHNEQIVYTGLQLKCCLGWGYKCVDGISGRGTDHVITPGVEGGEVRETA